MGMKNGYLAECNDAMARMYGRASAKELMGKPLSEFLVLHDPVTRQFMEDFIGAGYRITDQESRELDAQGHEKNFPQHDGGDRGGWALGADVGQYRAT